MYAALTSYGQTGPYRETAGHDINFESIAGLIDLNGPAGGEPAIPGVLIADTAAGGSSAVIHILAALLRRGDAGRPAGPGPPARPPRPAENVACQS